MKDKTILAKIMDALQQVKELAVSFAVLMLAHAEDIIFPQPPEPSLAPNMQFLALILGDLSPNMGYSSLALVLVLHPMEFQGKSRKWASSGNEQYLWPAFPHQRYS
jgi:hypothetical protein